MKKNGLKFLQQKKRLVSLDPVENNLQPASIVSRDREHVLELCHYWSPPQWLKFWIFDDGSRIRKNHQHLGSSSIAGADNQCNLSVKALGYWLLSPCVLEINLTGHRLAIKSFKGLRIEFSVAADVVNSAYANPQCLQSFVQMCGASHVSSHHQLPISSVTVTLL